ncbi:hypothetical protein [Thalassospira sp. ER-Se-21-Dark]|uniref:hypothetical protein n=1 Tax=Thalassospira sp. ER-Se-21-Dark TaxID=2585190 RepID=UPI001B3114F1|nr:hypothetical protein [Thalassospira sp. ER-Se-21-Dark]MBP3127992.1 amino acid ABC transporter substrate-binding protein [Thalassospira sp. ER-Se-21-Dark]
MVSFFRYFCGLAILPVMLTTPLYAETFKLPLPAGSETHFALQTGLLELALQYARGNNRLEIVPVDSLSQKRGFVMLDERQVDIALAGYSRYAESHLLQIDYPLTKGLQGYRLLITRPDMVEELGQVETLMDLKDVCIGSGNSWVDTLIFKQAGLCVVGGPGRNLYSMLKTRRFDVMHLAMHELETENVKRLLRQYDLVVYPKLLLRYPYDFYFYVRRDSKSLHDLIEQGFQAATENGAIDKYFQAHPGIAYATRFLQDHPDLRIIDLGNPEMTEHNSADIHRYWLEN